jgi:uncharacterized protein (DUF2141 family)
MLLTTFLTLLLGLQPKMTTLTIDIANVKKDEGVVMLAIHNRDNFLKERVLERVVAASGANLKITIDLPQGDYAVAVYQDKNQNKRLDTNFVGIPQEPYAFSNNARPKLRAPNFDEAKIGLWEQTKYINIVLQSW